MGNEVLGMSRMRYDAPQAVPLHNKAQFRSAQVTPCPSLVPEVESAGFPQAPLFASFKPEDHRGVFPNQPRLGNTAVGGIKPEAGLRYQKMDTIETSVAKEADAQMLTAEGGGKDTPTVEYFND